MHGVDCGCARSHAGGARVQTFCGMGQTGQWLQSNHVSWGDFPLMGSGRDDKCTPLILSSLFSLSFSLMGWHCRFCNVTHDDDSSFHRHSIANDDMAAALTRCVAPASGSPGFTVGAYVCCRPFVDGENCCHHRLKARPDLWRDGARPNSRDMLLLPSTRATSLLVAVLIRYD